MNDDIKRYDFKIEYDQFMTPFVWRVESETGGYCSAHLIEKLQDEIFTLRTKYNDWGEE